MLGWERHEGTDIGSVSYWFRHWLVDEFDLFHLIRPSRGPSSRQDIGGEKRDPGRNFATLISSDVEIAHW